VASGGVRRYKHCSQLQTSVTLPTSIVGLAAPISQQLHCLRFGTCHHALLPSHPPFHHPRLHPNPQCTLSPTSTVTPEYSTVMEGMLMWYLSTRRVI
jgi:hypothetical protein